MSKKIAGGARKATTRTSGQKSAQVRARIDPDVKKEAEEILDELGLNPSSAISAFYKQIVLRRALPFTVSIPNAATVAAIEEARKGTDLIEGGDLQGLLAQLIARRDRTIDLVDLVQDSPKLLEVLSQR